MTNDSLHAIIEFGVPALATLAGVIITAVIGKISARDSNKVAPYEEMAKRLDKVERRSDEQDETIDAQQKVIQEQGGRIVKLEIANTRWEGFYSWLHDDWPTIRLKERAPAHPTRGYTDHDDFSKGAGYVD